MEDPLISALAAALEAAVAPHAAADGLAPEPAFLRPDGVLLAWEKAGADAPDGERDRLELTVSRVPGGARVDGRVRSWMRTEDEPIAAFAIARRHGPWDPAAGLADDPVWEAYTPADVPRVAAEVEALVAGQVIPWLDEPVPLAAAHPASRTPFGGLAGLVTPPRRSGS